MSKLREAARGQMCTLRLEGCNYDPATSVLAHIRMSGHCGMGIKPHDIKSCIACSHCHDVIDGRVKGEFSYKDVLRGHFETLDIFLNMGLLKVAK